MKEMKCDSFWNASGKNDVGLVERIRDLPYELRLQIAEGFREGVRERAKQLSLTKAKYRMNKELRRRHHFDNPDALKIAEGEYYSVGVSSPFFRPSIMLNTQESMELAGIMLQERYKELMHRQFDQKMAGALTINHYKN